MIELINVSKYYVTDFGRHYLFRDVSLVLPLDKSVAVIGPNGAGKSTFLRLLGGADIPSEGRIIKTGKISPPMGLTPGLQPSLTGLENARFAGRIHGMSRDEILDLIDHVRLMSDIGHFFDMPVGTYSAGMRQRVAFSINMAMEYDYYLFDEIGAGGDREFRKTAKVLVQERLKSSNFIIVSHRRDELIDICDAGIVIQNGTLTYFDTIEDALAAYNTDDDDAPVKNKRRNRDAAEEAAPAARAGRKKRKRARQAEALPQGETPASAETAPVEPPPRRRMRRKGQNGRRGQQSLAAAAPPDAGELASSAAGTGAGKQLMARRLKRLQEVRAASERIETPEVSAETAVAAREQAKLRQVRAEAKAARARRLLLQHLGEPLDGRSAAPHRTTLIAAAQESASAQAAEARQYLSAPGAGRRRRKPAVAEGPASEPGPADTPSHTDSRRGHRFV